MKFEGGYHGGHDYALMSAAPRSPKAFPAATADSAGIPHVLEGEVLIAPYNDLATVEALLAVYADELTAVVVEPFQRLISPQPGFLAGLRTLTQRHGIPLIFDVVVTDRPVTDYRATLTANGAHLGTFNAECLRRGVVKGTSKIYVTLAHSDADVARTLAVFAEAIEAVSRSEGAARS